MDKNQFQNSDDFEDVFSNSSESNSDEYEDISSNSPSINNKDIPLFNKYEELNDNSSDYNIDRDDDFTVKYNSAVQNRRRQQIEYEDVSDIYKDTVSQNDKTSKKASKKDTKKNGKKHYTRNTIIAILCVVLVLASSVGFYGAHIANRLLSSVKTDEDLKENEYIDSSLLYNNKQQVNVLLVGVDALNGGTTCRSDTMMLLTLDNENKQIKLTSFLRDSYVQIAGSSKAKLNASYARGGIQKLVDTLEMNFKVEIPYYVVVDFSIFKDVIDLLGGVEVDVTEKESKYTQNNAYDDNKLTPIKAGKNIHLNGEEALWYSRIRYLDDDFHRTKRQQKVISAAISKTKEKNINELVGIAEKIIPMIKTNLSSKDIIQQGKAAFFNKAYGYPIFRHQVPATGSWKSQTISGQGSCLVLDMDKNVKLFHDFLDNPQVEITTSKAS